MRHYSSQRNGKMPRDAMARWRDAAVAPPDPQTDGTRRGGHTAQGEADMGRNVSGAETLLRQWHMLRAVPRHPRRIGVPEIRSRLAANGFRVSARTVQRDLIELTRVFPLVSDERAKPFGWSWAKNAPLFDVPNLTDQEALTLAMVEDFLRPLLPSALLDELRPHFTAAKKRLTADSGKKGSASWLGKVAVIQSTQALIPPKIDPQVQRIVTDALLTDRRIGVKYRRKGERELRGYVLSPLGLVQRGPVPYLLACVGEYQDPMSFVMHRFARATLLEAPATRPKDFDLAAYLAKKGILHFGSEATIALDVLFDAAAAEHLQETPLSLEQSLQTVSDGRVRLRARVGDTPELRWWLQGFGDQVEVRGPPALRHAFAESAKVLAARYAG